MDRRAAITRVLREQRGQGNMIETLWQLFAAHVAVPPGGVQWIESRRCFFAGASTLFEAVLLILEPGTEATEADLATMDAIATELTRYAEDLTHGRA